MTINVAAMKLDDGAELERVMRQFYPLLLEDAVLMAGEQLGVTIAFDLANPNVQRVLDQLATKVRQVAETTRDEIRALVGQQADLGWSMSQLAAAIRQHASEISSNRAMTIAVTETASAQSAGALLGYQESGVVAKKEWLISDPCPICAPLADQQVALDANFDNGAGWSGPHPPAHPNCRCAIAPIVED